MGFNRVRFNNFRNIESREMKWFPGLNLLTGGNGTGKTNILEGINIISGWGPLERGTKSASLPTWNSGSGDVWLTGQLDSQAGGIIKVKISSRSTIKLDDKPINATELRLKIPILSFLPNDMAIIEDSASYRRRLLDMLLAMIIPPYAMRLHDYRRCVRQKTALLRQGAPTMMIDKMLLPMSVWIWEMREEAVFLLSSCLENMNSMLPCQISLFFRRGGGGLAEEANIDYIESLSRYRAKEAVMKVPLVGPHRDDFVIRTNGRSAAEVMSRGFRRRTAIALMLAASDGVKRKLGKDPVLLLDEVTAELDAEGRKLLFDALLARKTQVFAATAEPFADGFPGMVYEVKSGRVKAL